MVKVINENIFNQEQNKNIETMINGFNVYEGNGQITDSYFSSYNKQPVLLSESIIKTVLDFVKFEIGVEYIFHQSLINWVGVGTNENDKFHRDRFSDLTFLFYPNDDYIGGELEWKNFDGTVESYKPSKGSSVMIIGIDEHRVKKVTKGDRYSLVVFLNKIKKDII